VDWVWAFLFTQVIEIPIYMRGLSVKPYEAFGASALTHPIVWFVIPSLVYHLYDFLHSLYPAFQLASAPRYWVMVVIAEIFAVVAEAIYFRVIGKEKTWRWSFLANMASVSLGLASRSLWGWP
jgi:hypothetical protein